MKKFLFNMVLLFCVGLFATKAYAGQRITYYDTSTGKTVILADGSANQVITTDGSEGISWEDAAGGGSGAGLWTSAGSILSPDLTRQGNDVSIATVIYIDTSEQTMSIGANPDTTPDADLHIQGTVLIDEDLTIDRILSVGNTFYVAGQVSGWGNVGLGTWNPGASPPNGWAGGQSPIFEFMSPSSNTDIGFFLRRSDSVVGMDMWVDGGVGDSLIDNLWNNNAALMKFRMKTAGTPINVFTLMGSGNVGIMDTDPDANLEVVDDFMVSSAAGNDGDLFSVTNSGDVGIGIVAPNSKLDVQGNLSVSNNLSVTNELQIGGLVMIRDNGDAGDAEFSEDGGGTWTDFGAGGGGGATTDGGDVTYVTSATDDFAIGGTDADSPFFFDEGLQQLEIDGDISGSGLLTISNTGYKPYVENLSITGVSNTKTNVTVSHIMVGGITIKNFTGTVDISTTGAGGRDTADSEDAWRWYELLMIADVLGNANVILNKYLTESGATSISLPGTYTHKRRIGFVLNDGSSNCGTVSNSLISKNYLKGRGININFGSKLTQDGSTQSYDLSKYIPPDAIGVNLYVSVFDASTAGLDISLRTINRLLQVCRQPVANIGYSTLVNTPVYDNGKLFYYAADSGIDTLGVNPRAWTIGKEENK